jgi:MFS family permease
LHEQEDKIYELSPYRYVDLILFVCVAAVNKVTAQTFASINRLVQDRYNYPAELVTFICLLSSITHPFIVTPCNFILDKFGIKIGCSIGGVLVIVGSWTKILMDV